MLCERPARPAPSMADNDPKHLQVAGRAVSGAYEVNLLRCVFCFAMVFFILVGALSVAMAVGVVTARVPVHSALFLLVHFVTLAILYVTLDAQFLAAAQVIVYAGGIVILILFVIMSIGSGESGDACWLSLMGAAWPGWLWVC